MGFMYRLNVMIPILENEYCEPLFCKETCIIDKINLTDNNETDKIHNDTINISIH